jgi:carbonic anhydrase
MTERYLGDDLSYPPALGPVLLLSCMDPRLLDDIVHFMNHDNLSNRYDHVILAGAALGALGGCKPEYDHWKKTFFDHLAGAVQLHGVEDIYIIEHRHCGAYHKLFKVVEEFGDTPAEQVKEAQLHWKYTDLLTREIDQWAAKNDVPLRVRAFLMDVRGRVSQLGPQKEAKETRLTKGSKTSRKIR